MAKMFFVVASNGNFGNNLTSSQCCHSSRINCHFVFFKIIFDNCVDPAVSFVAMITLQKR